jgi:hypothetical protein
MSTNGIRKMVRPTGADPLFHPLSICQKKTDTMPFQKAATKIMPKSFPRALGGFKTTGPDSSGSSPSSASTKRPPEGAPAAAAAASMDRCLRAPRKTSRIPPRPAAMKTAGTIATMYSLPKERWSAASVGSAGLT